MLHYTTELASVTAVKRDASTPPNPYATGYGSKIPTAYGVRFGSRWHRVYVMQYGNAGSAYVLSRGVTYFLGTDLEHALPALANGETWAAPDVVERLLAR